MIGTATGPSVSGDGLSQSAYTPISIGLSALAAQSSAVTFRFDPIFAAGSSMNGSTGQRRGSLDNVALNGTATTAVPEPSTYFLLGIGMLCVFGQTYRGHKKAHRS